MSLTPREMADMADLQRRLADAEARLRRMPVRFGRGGSGGSGAAATPIWQVFDGTLLTYINAPGIVRRTDTVLASEFPAGSGGTSGDTVEVPAWPSHPTLPSGVGVLRQVNADGVYAFVVNDARQTVAGPDLVVGEIVLSAGTVDLDVLSGGVTYRYVCHIPAPGWW